MSFQAALLPSRLAGSVGNEGNEDTGSTSLPHDSHQAAPHPDTAAVLAGRATALVTHNDTGADLFFRQAGSMDGAERDFCLPSGSVASILLSGVAPLDSHGMEASSSGGVPPCSPHTGLLCVQVHSVEVSP